MAKYRITGIYKDTGDPADVTFTARTQDDAESQAFDQGILISETVKLKPPLIPKEMRIPLIGLTGTILFCLIVAVTMLPKPNPQPEPQPTPVASAYKPPQTKSDYDEAISPVSNIKPGTPNHPLSDFEPEIINLVYNGTLDDWFNANRDNKNLLCAAFSKHFSTKNLNYPPSVMRECLDSSIKQDKQSDFESAPKIKMIELLAAVLLIYKQVNRSPLDKAMDHLESIALYDLGMTDMVFRSKVNGCFTDQRHFLWNEHPKSTSKWSRMSGTYREAPGIKIDYVSKNKTVYIAEISAILPREVSHEKKDSFNQIIILDSIAVQLFPIKNTSGWIVKSFIEKGKEVNKGITTSQFGYKIVFAAVPLKDEVRYYLMITREKPW